MATLRFRELPAIIPGKTDVFTADPRQINVDAEYNCRDMKSAETLAHIDWLADEIENTGFNPEMPLTVRRRGADVILVRGHCRLAALHKLIAKGIEVEGVPVMQIAAGTSDIDLIFDQEASNYGLRLDPLARARLVLRAKRLGVSDDEIARRMHWKSTGSVKQHLDMLGTLPEPVKEQVRAGDIAATEAMKLVKNLPAGTDPNEAAKIIAANKEENARIRGKDKSHKVTAKTLARDKPKPTPKSDPPKPEPAKAETPAPIMAPNAEVAPPAEMTGTRGHSPLAEDRPPVMRTLTDEEKAARAEALGDAKSHEVHPQLQTAAARELPAVAFEKPRNGVEGLLLKFLNADVLTLATMYRRLVGEREQAAGEGHATEAQEQLCVAADVIGVLRFPDQWEQAKGNSELAEVA